jgi:cyclophilin family peptidyl-prolyl cis-trans isomerase
MTKALRNSGVAPDEIDYIVAHGTSTPLNDATETRAIKAAYGDHAKKVAISSPKSMIGHLVGAAGIASALAGLGAIRREALEALGGFDQRFVRPSVEDIELGYRLTGLGYKILLDPTIQGCHLKRWTLKSAIVTDVRDRGIPWTQLMLKFARLDNDLNLQTNQRLAVVLAYSLLPLLALTKIAPIWFGPIGVVLLALDVERQVAVGRRPVGLGDSFHPANAVETLLEHIIGTVSMARSGPDTATSDFFILLNDQPSLDFGGKRFDDGQGAAAFGRVVAGMAIVQQIQRRPTDGQSLTPPIRIISATRVR